MSVGIQTLRNDSLQNYASSIRDLFIEGAYELKDIESNVFQNCSKLRTLYITQAPKLKRINDGVFAAFLPSFKMLRIAHTGLEMVPNMNLLKTDPTIISMIDFDSNNIKNITSSSVKVKAENLILDHNEIEVIEDWSFHDSQIANLSLKGNRNLRLITNDAFTGLKNLRTLDLSETSIRRLPTRGLENLEVLRIKDTTAMREFPSVLHFPEMKEALLTYPYHCCAFKFPVTHDPIEFSRLQSLRKDVHRRYCASTTTEATPPDLTTPWRRRRFVSSFSRGDYNGEDEDVVYGQVVYTPPPDNNQSSHWESGIDELMAQEGFFDPIYSDISDHHQHLNGREDIQVDGIFHARPITIRPDDPVKAVCGHFARDFRQVTCYPEPDAFNPCEDVMGHWVLRVVVWFVALAAMLGNLAVLVVILTARSKLSVSMFLMCHLAFADFCMGLYLLIIAVVDVRTMGTYFNHAIDWQQGAGCQVAGFLTVFASELSIFTLTVITLERWYAITYAIHLNRRLHLGTAARVMAVGWLYAALVAALPLAGVSGYARTSICLPMENDDAADLGYLICLLSVKGLAFLLICTCYAKMYLSIRASSLGGIDRQTPDLHANRAVRSDLSVAKRMAMLVFTDFACWAPIAFFGLTAVFGMPLIDVTKSKILLVFFYPLNSCANPFLYVILTKQYRKDVYALLLRMGFCRRKNSCVHGRTLSSNTNQQRRVSSVKTLYRNSLVGRGAQRQQVVLTAGRRLPGMAQSGNVAGDMCVLDARSSSMLPGNISKEGSPAVHRGSPHPIKNSFTKLQHPDQQLILRRVLEFPASASTSLVTTTTDTTTTDGPASIDDDDAPNRDTAV